MPIYGATPDTLMMRPQRCAFMSGIDGAADVERPGQVDRDRARPRVERLFEERALRRDSPRD